VSGLNPGSHTVTLGGTAFNCAVASGNPRSVGVVAGVTADISFAITCTAPALTGKFAFMRPLEGKQQIYVMHGDGSSPTRVSDGSADDRDPAWSPDGRIAFTSDRDGSAEVYVMNADGSGLSRLTNNPAALGAAWSPDGRKIAFTSNRDGYAALYVMNADGSEQTKLAGDSLWTWAAPAWSPDGAKLAFTLARRHGCCDTSWVSIMDVDGTNLRTVYT
jgi:Tol biopolymer transport system component